MAIKALVFSHFSATRYILHSVCMVVLLLILCYLSHHGMYGPKGYYAYVAQRQHLKELSQECAHLKCQYLLMRQRARAFQKCVDKNLLEQCAWNMLRYVHPSVTVVPIQAMQT